MKGILVDSNIILNIFLDDPDWAEWSEAALSEYSIHTPLYINPIIFPNGQNYFSERIRKESEFVDK